MEQRLLQVMIQQTTISFSKFHSYVYKLLEETSSLTHCGGHCFFFKEDPCHFYVYHDNVCYLGNFGSSNDIVPTSDTTTDLYMNSGLI